MKYLQICLLTCLLTSCAFIYSGNKQRDIQTKIMRLITDKSKNFANCAKKSDLFKAFEQNRVSMTLFLEINNNGQLEKFNLDDKNYPGNFTDCVFEVVELINFPKNNKHDLIRINQPFIFSAKN